ncbi:MAG: hypothetical protein HYR67_02705 [Bacteroidetes bacterium]|nr:hypothetical protein [Bacteroidota bacterium]
MEESTPNWFGDYKLHWIGFAAISMLYSVISALAEESSSLLLKFIASLFVFVAITICLSLFLLFIWPKRNLHISRFLNILLVLSFVLLTSQIISLMLNFVRGGN